MDGRDEGLDFDYATATEIILGDRTGGRLLWDSRWSIAILLTSGVATAYFWQVLREDRSVIGKAEVSARPAARKRVTVMLVGAPREAVSRIESTLGQEVVTWRAEAAGDSIAEIEQSELDAIARQVREAEQNEVMLLVEGGRVRVIPYSR